MLTQTQYQQILEGNFYCRLPDGQMVLNDIYISLDYESKRNLHIIPGSFNPKHHQHDNLFFEAEKRFPGDPILFEVSISRVGKENFSLLEINKIIEQFSWFATVIVTNKKYFREKYTLFPECQCHWWMGIDTFSRLLNMNGQYEKEFYNQKFFVGDRVLNGIRYGLNDIPAYPNNSIRIFEDLSDDLLSISSTQLRNK